jgi:hypothetical protein
MRTLLITAALVLAAAAPATAPARWKEIGKTSSNNVVSIDSKSVKTANGIITAHVQVRFVTPVETPKGTWRLSRHVAMFNCAKKTVAAKSSTYYSDVAAKHVVETHTVCIPGYGPAIGGSMTQVALDYVCKK